MYNQNPYVTAIKVIVIAYILITPVSNIYSPIINASKNVWFVWAFMTSCVIIAAYFDLVLAILLMLVLLIWMSIAMKQSQTPQVKQHFVNQEGLTSKNSPPKMKVENVMNMREQVHLFTLPPADEEPVSANEYEHTTHYDLQDAL